MRPGTESMRTMRLGGMRGFTIVWIGQLVSLLGSAMTGFALPIWAYEKYQSVTALTTAQFFFITPMLIVSPLAGALVDRSNRKFMMMISDLAAGLSTIGVFLLASANRLEIWHLYIANAINGTFQAFQWPAYSATISTMLPKEQYGRANGMMGLAEAAPAVIAPMLAAGLLTYIGLSGVLLIDIVTFVFAIGALLIVFVPQPPETEVGRQSRGSIWKESAYGFRYIVQRPSLLGLQTVFLFGNLFATIAFAAAVPMILSRTGSNKDVLATALAIGAIGGVVGGIVMSAWGGPKRRVHGVLAGWIAVSLVSQALAGLGQSLPVWAAAFFFGSFFVPIINGSNQAIWQAKVAPDVQGRVFATRRLIAWFVTPLATAIAGPLADVVFGPAMQPGGSLAPVFGGLVGTGPGAGIGLMFVFTGLMAMCVGLGGYLVPAIRNAEDILPDHDAQPAPATVEAMAVEAT